MSDKILDLTKKFLSIIILVVNLVEGPTDGKEKKREAIELIQKILKDFLPDWSIELFLNESILGYIIDYLVEKFNSQGEFVHYSNE